MLKKLLIGIAVIIAGILLFAATKPGTFRIERSITINAPPEKIHPLLNDFHAWPQWSPWEKLDPDMKRTHSGAPSGVGAVYAWEGNDDVGKGRMEITGDQPPSNVTIKLDFLAPFESHNTTHFALDPDGGVTRLTWAMTGENNYMAKLFSVFMNMDAMIGKDFEAGLGTIKQIAEKSG